MARANRDDTDSRRATSGSEAPRAQPGGSAGRRSRKNGKIEAAGGVVQRGRGGYTEVLIIHRPRYDDWSLPKGKLHSGEEAAEAALREVAEETGVTCRLGAEAGVTRYEDSRGRQKRVRYWLMEPLREDPGAVPNSEVDETRWVDAAEAVRILTYPHDRDLVAGLSLVC